jgi:hypothetical protein
VALGLYHGTELFLRPVLGPVSSTSGALSWITAGIPVVTLIALLVLHALLPAFGKTSAGRAFRVHALHGFYFGVIADRIVDRIWNWPVRKELSHA